VYVFASGLSPFLVLEHCFRQKKKRPKEHEVVRKACHPPGYSSSKKGNSGLKCRKSAPWVSWEIGEPADMGGETSDGAIERGNRSRDLLYQDIDAGKIRVAAMLVDMETFKWRL